LYGQLGFLLKLILIPALMSTGPPAGLNRWRLACFRQQTRKDYADMFTESHETRCVVEGDHRIDASVALILAVDKEVGMALVHRLACATIKYRKLTWVGFCMLGIYLEFDGVDDGGRFNQDFLGYRDHRRLMDSVQEGIYWQGR
jgi:hypothetical protein